MSSKENLYPCTKCRGKGSITVSNPEGDYEVSCDNCRGSGQEQVKIARTELVTLQKDSERLEYIVKHWCHLGVHPCSDDTGRWYSYVITGQDERDVIYYADSNAAIDHAIEGEGS